MKGLLAKLDGKLEDLTIDITHVDETNGIECSSLKRLYIEARYGLYWYTFHCFVM